MNGFLVMSTKSIRMDLLNIKGYKGARLRKHGQAIMKSIEVMVRQKFACFYNTFLSQSTITVA